MSSLIRGKTPEDIEKRCLQLCSDYLGGQWIHINTKQLVFKRITGGFTNQMYFCSLPNDMKPISDEPKEVILKFYGEKQFKTNDETLDDKQRSTDSIISLTVANNKLGPHIYGLFPSGQILQFIQHKMFERIDQTDGKIVRELAQKLAKYHSMKVPIKRTNDWYLSLLDTTYDISYERFPLNQMFAENNLKFLRDNDLKQEFIWIKNIITKSKTPFVLSHNDFRNANILIRTGAKHENNKIILCDFENSRYGYRGVDFACILSEWDRDLSDFNMYWKSVEDNSIPDFSVFPDYPKDSTLKPFLKEYIRESVKIYGNEYAINDKNSVNRLLAEVKLFTLLYKLFVVLVFMKTNEGIGGKQFDKILTLKFADYFYGHYFHLKNLFIKEEIIKSLENLKS